MKKILIFILAMVSVTLLVDALLDAEKLVSANKPQPTHKANWSCKVGDVEIQFQNMLQADALVEMQVIVDGASDLEGQLPKCEEIK